MSLLPRQTLFSCYVSEQAGRPVAGCQVRVANILGNDVTVKVSGGYSVMTTGADGYFRNTLSFGILLASVLPAGSYTIIASAPGYEPYAQLMILQDTRFVNLSIILLPAAAPASDVAGYDGPQYVSPMYPVDVLVPASAEASAWELIEASLTNSAGKTSVIRVQATGENTRINLQARLLLKPVPVLVPDTAPGVIDPYFSDEFTATLARLTPSGRRELTGSVSVRAANAFPDGDTNDLTGYTNAATGGLAQWLTPWTELPKFDGHYADAMIWLPVAGAGAYTMLILWKNRNRVFLSGTTIPLDSALFDTGRVSRIRIPEPVEGAHFADITISRGNTTQTKPLTVRYVHA